MSKEKNWFNSFTSLMDQNIRGVQLGVYSIAGLGLVIALRSVRPFLKFTSPSKVPLHFIEKRMTFQGKVKSLQPSTAPGKNPTLLIDHHPLFQVSKSSSQWLPVQVLGVDISSNGFIWMQSMLVGAEIKFTPFKADDDQVHSVVYKNKQNVGHHLVSIGFATVSGIDFDLEKDAQYMKYYKCLLAEEERAERKCAGIWSDSRPKWSASLYGKIRSRIPISIR